MSETGPMAVVIDACAFMAPFQYGFNLELELTRLFGEYEVIVPSGVITELEGITDKHKGPALKLARMYDVIDSEQKKDDAVIEAALVREGCVMTLDKELMIRLRWLNIPIVTLKSDHLVYEKY